jgi:hypothetical protein
MAGRVRSGSYTRPRWRWGIRRPAILDGNPTTSTGGDATLTTPTAAATTQTTTTGTTTTDITITLGGGGGGGDTYTVPFNDGY